MIRRAEVTYHGPHHDYAGRIIGWPARHLVVVAVTRRPGEDYEVCRQDAIEAAHAYCSPGGYDEPADGNTRRAVFTYGLKLRGNVESVAVVMEPAP